MLEDFIPKHVGVNPQTCWRYSPSLAALFPKADDVLPITVELDETISD